MSSNPHFSSSLFAFLRELKQHNNRRWFEAHREVYERELKDASIRFILDIGPKLHKLNEHISANPRPVGGSLFRIYRDVRFSKDKSPYKTHIGMHFPVRSTLGKNAPHSAGFYLHIDPEGSFGGGGIWRPEADALANIREAIAERPKEWMKIRKKLEIEGESLKRPPSGFPPDHPCIEDLKLKDFFVSEAFSEREVTGTNFLDRYVDLCRTISPLIEFLNRALGLPW